MFSNPYLLEMTRDECRGMLRRLELECYSSVLNAFRAQGVLNQNKNELLQNLRNVFNISQERHRAEARRVANDEKLCTIADTISGSNTYQEWLKEGRRHYPLSRSIPLTSLSYISNKVIKNISKRNDKLKNTNGNNISEDVPSEVNNTVLEKNTTIADCLENPKNFINFSNNQHHNPLQNRKHLEYPNSRIQYLYHVHNMSLMKKRKDGIKKLKNLDATKRKNCKNLNPIETKVAIPADLVQNDVLDTTVVGNESTDLQIATSKKDISVNFSKLNSQMLTQKNIIFKDDSVKIPSIQQKPVINVNNKIMTSSNITATMNSPQKLDLQLYDNIVNDSNNCNTVNQIGLTTISDKILNSNEDFVCRQSSDNDLSNISFITNNEHNSNLDIKNAGNAIAVKKIGPLIVRNIKLPHNINFKSDRNKKHLNIVTSGARKVFIQPNKEFQNRFNNTSFINTIKTSQITPLNIKSAGCTTFKKITPITNINAQHLNIRKPNMVILQQTNQRNQSTITDQTIKSNNVLDSTTILPIQSISGFQKKKVIVIGSIANAENPRIQNKTSNIETTAANIITEDTPVDILPISDFYIDNFNYQKVNISNEVVSNNNFITENETIYQEETIDMNDSSDSVIGTTDWELALDQEANKSKENILQYRQKNIYSDENTIILSSNSNNSDNYHDLNEDIIDETYKYQ